eukprot:Nitzschia sp. Nitz4//scaffold28_size193895//94899//95324//NITZ4_001658-RA/size193895-processed-gene-0.225-mRNA-1//1//CDS//3329545961//5672//frame0
MNYSIVPQFDNVEIQRAQPGQESITISTEPRPDGTILKQKVTQRPNGDTIMEERLLAPVGIQETSVSMPVVCILPLYRSSKAPRKVERPLVNRALSITICCTLLLLLLILLQFVLLRCMLEGQDFGDVWDSLHNLTAIHHG